MMWSLKPKILQLTGGRQKELWESHLNQTWICLCKSLTKKELKDPSHSFVKAQTKILNFTHILYPPTNCPFINC